jgi:hypothetical protein
MQAWHMVLREGDTYATMLVKVNGVASMRRKVFKELETIGSEWQEVLLGW